MDRFDLQQFETPSDLKRPVYSWEWSCKLSKERIRKQLEEIKKHDVHTVYILPMPPTFRPDSTYSELNVPYMGEEYLKFMRYTAECAKELDMVMWLYDEPGWPSGNAGREVVDSDPSTAIKWVEKREVTVEKGTVYRPGKEVIATFDEGVRITGDFCPDKDVTVLEYFWDGRRRFSRADLLEPKTTEKFIECTYEKHYKETGDLFGNVIKYMFTDEPSVIGYPWPYDFAERFIETYGYDIRDYMPLFLCDGKKSEKGIEVCIHYHELISNLFAERYFGTIQKWCHDHNIEFVGHIDRDHEIRDLKRCKYGYLMNIMRKFDVPGIDVIIRQVYPAENPCAEGYGFFPRIASSAAAQNGKKDALTESFGVAGAGMTPDMLRYVVNYQLIRGINILQFQSLDSKENAPSRPLTGKEQTLTDYYPEFHTYAARVSQLITLGDTMADTALYIPVRDIFASDEYECQAAADFEAAGYELEKMGIDFDLIDDTVIREAVRDGDALKIGLATYRNIIVPADMYMPEDVREKIAGINDKATRNLILKSEKLRTKSRLLSDGSQIVMIFNESIHDVQEMINFPKKQYLYELNLTSGELISSSYDSEVAFDGGELKAFLVTDEEMPARTAYEAGTTVVVDSFEEAVVKSFYIDKNGTQFEDVVPQYKQSKLGPWKESYGQEFSGKVSYKAEATVPEGEGRAYCIDLGEVECCATVLVNGEEVGICAMSPKQVIIPYDKMPKGKVSLEIIVANTVANQYAFGDYEQYFTSMELGPYHPRMKAQEAEEAAGGLYGPVTISILK